MFEPVSVEKEVFGQGENLLQCGNVLALPAEFRALYGQAQCVYLDPPFMTGKLFQRKRCYGEQGWRKGTPALMLPAFQDQYENETVLFAYVPFEEDAPALVHRCVE